MQVGSVFLAEGLLVNYFSGMNNIRKEHSGLSRSCLVIVHRQYDCGNHFSFIDHVRIRNSCMFSKGKNLLWGNVSSLGSSSVSSSRWADKCLPLLLRSMFGIKPGSDNTAILDEYRKSITDYHHFNGIVCTVPRRDCFQKGYFRWGLS